MSWKSVIGKIFLCPPLKFTAVSPGNLQMLHDKQAMTYRHSHIPQGLKLEALSIPESAMITLNFQQFRAVKSTVLLISES